MEVEPEGGNPAEAEELSAHEFRLTLDKSAPGTLLGVDVGTQDGELLLVRTVSERGLVAGWNAQARLSPLEQLRPGDAIVEVNGIRGSAAEILEECKKNQVLRVVARRHSPVNFPVDVERVTTEERLGVDVDTADAASILIDGVSADGLVGRWNAAQGPGARVRAGDRIVAINGARGNVQAMLAECNERLRLQLVLRREPAGGDSGPAAPPSPRRGFRADARGAMRRLAEADEEAQMAWAMAESARLAGLESGGAAPVTAVVPLPPPRPPVPASEPLLAPDVEVPRAARRCTQPPPGPPPPDAECRLCLEAGSERLIAPCDCQGSMGWVHRSCLNEWRSRTGPESARARAMTECPTCHVEYDLANTTERDDRRRNRLYCFRVSRDSILAFVVVQAFLCLVALLLRLCDSGERVPHFFHVIEDRSWVSRHWWQDFFQHEFFHYYAAAVVVSLFSLGATVVAGFCVSFCCPCLLPERVRERLSDHSMRMVVILAVCSGIICSLFIVVVVAVGAFVALFLFTLFAQKLAQRYLEGRHLRGVAERFAVVDRAGSSQTLKAADVECGRQAQEEIKRRLLAEVRAVTGASADE